MWSVSIRDISCVNLPFVCSKMADETLNEGTSSSQASGESSESTIEINIKTLDSQINTFRVNKDVMLFEISSNLFD